MRGSGLIDHTLNHEVNKRRTRTSFLLQQNQDESISISRSGDQAPTTTYEKEFQIPARFQIEGREVPDPNTKMNCTDSLNTSSRDQDETETRHLHHAIASSNLSQDRALKNPPQGAENFTTAIRRTKRL